MGDVPGPAFQPFNPFPQQDKPGYDILLSLSQKKLQEQIQLLYDTPVASTSFVPPGSTAPAAPKQYLISHQLRLLLPRTSRKNPNRVFNDSERQGILGHILCPQITLLPGRYRTVQLKFTFTSAAPGEVDPAYTTDSVLQDIDEDNEIYPITINGWSFSFEADLSTSKPMNIMNDIIKLAIDPTEPVVLPAKTQARFQELADITAKPAHVDSRTFLASSVFCLFQSTQITSSFKLTDDQGKMLSIDDFQTIKTFNTAISTYFTTLRNSELPTVENPFVLGYAITQHIPALTDVNVKATTDKTPKYFIPRRYDIAVTPPPADFNMPGALTFCLQTFRSDPKEEDNVDLAKTPNAGVFYYTLAQNVAPHGRPGNHDGIMVLSRKNFLDRFAADMFESAFWLNPETILKNAGCSSMNYVKDTTIVDGDKPKWERAVKLEGNTVMVQNSEVQQSLKVPTCSSKITIECSSDWADAVNAKKEGEFKSNSKRETFITITTEAITTVIHKSQLALKDDDGDGFASIFNGIKSIIQNNLGFGDVEDMPEIHRVISILRYRYIFKLAAGEAGAWNVQLLDSSVQPKFKNNNTELDWTRIHNEYEESGYGTLVRVVKGAVQGAVENAFDLDHISQNIAAQDVKTGKVVVSELQDKLKKVSESFSTTIMMPAGDIFMFKDMDTDQFGNLYCGVNYATVQGGNVVKKPLS